MAIGTLTIDQTPCRASYGLLTQAALRQDTYQRQKSKVLENIGDIVAEGDREAQIWSSASSIPAIAADSYGYNPLTVALVPVDRPIIDYYPATGNNVDIAV